MPALRLLRDIAERASRFAVVGKYLSDEGTTFVQHVALLQEETELRYAARDIRVWHMGPPVVAGPTSTAAVTSEEATCTTHLLGKIELDADDIEGIETWLAEVDKEKRPSAVRQYIVHPPMLWVEDEKGARLYRRFSCVGFVLECYRWVGVDLLDDLNDGGLPLIDLEIVAQAYGPDIRRERIRERLGIPGNGPWRIALAGYVMHAFDRNDKSIRQNPYLPISSEERHFAP